MNFVCRKSQLLLLELLLAPPRVATRRLLVVTRPERKVFVTSIYPKI
jgi:hypothetical protein